jgi:hypothetical protein
MRIREFAAAIAASAFLTACSASTENLTGTTAPAIARIVITPARDTIVVGQTATWIAVALDDAGRPVAGVSFEWTSSQARVAPVVPGSPSDTAHSTGDSVGVTQITASIGNMRSAPTDLIVVPATPTDSSATTPGGSTRDSTPGTIDTTKTALIACGGVSLRVRSWTAHITESYAYSTSGVDNQGNQRTFKFNDSGDLTARLDLDSDDDKFAYFQGQMQGTASIHDQSTDAFPDGNVVHESDDGSGPILDPASLGNASAIIYLTIDKTTCHYQFYAPSAYVTTTLVQTDDRGQFTSQSPDFTGILYSRYFPIDSLSGSAPALSGRGGFLAGEWIDMRALNYSDPNPPASAPFGYYWGVSLMGLGMFDPGLATSGKAGAADISWSFTPIR